MSEPEFFLSVFIATQAYNLVVTGGGHFCLKTPRHRVFIEIKMELEKIVWLTANVMKQLSTMLLGV